MNKSNRARKIITKFLIAASMVLFVFSIGFITIAYNVSSMKSAMNSNHTYDSPDIEKLRTLYPDFFTLASLEIKFPAGKIPILAGSTFEAHLNKMYKGKNTEDWGYRYSIISAMGEFNKITDEAYVNSFYDLNAAFVKEIISSYERPFFENSSEAKLIINYANSKIFEQCWLAGVINNSLILKTAYRSLGKKDYDLALKSDIAYLRFTSVEGVLGAPSLSNIINYAIYNENKFAKDIYIKENAFLTDDALRNKFKSALIKRVEFIKARPDFAVAFKNTVALLKRKTNELKFKDKATLYTLNLWYGDPNAPFIEAADMIYSKKGAGYSEYEKVLFEMRQKYPVKRNFTNELAYTGDDILSIFKFIKFAVNTHPLEPNSYIPTYELSHYINIDTKFRITTLGGLMRLFYAQNKRWPDLETDRDFVKEAGPAALEGYSNKNFKIIKSKNEDSITIQSEVKDWYDPYKKTAGYIQTEVPKPF